MNIKQKMQQNAQQKIKIIIGHLNFLLLGLFSLLLVGCATPYSCGKLNQSGCQSVSKVYQRTSYKENNSQATSGIRGGAEKRSSSNPKIRISATSNALQTIKPGDPLLTSPTVMRILLTSWEDKEKDLNAGGYVYIRVKESQWVLGK